MLLWLPIPGAVLIIAGLAVVGIAVFFLLTLARDAGEGDHGEIVDEMPPRDD